MIENRLNAKCHVLFKGPTNTKFFDPSKITGIKDLDKAHWVIVKSVDKVANRINFHNPYGEKNNDYSLSFQEFNILLKKYK